MKRALFAYLDKEPTVVPTGYDYIISHGFRRGVLQPLFDANPNAKWLLYEFNGGCADGVARQDPIGRDWVNAHRPEWWLRDAAGEIARFKGWNWILGLDTGDPACGMMWAACALADVKNYGADGLFVDNGNSHYGWNYDGLLPAYPTQAAYGAAQDGFMSSVATVFKGSGFPVVINLSGEVWNEGLPATWARRMGGCLYETPQGFGNGMPQEVDQRFLALKRSFSMLPSKPLMQMMRPDLTEAAARYSYCAYRLMETPASLLCEALFKDGTLRHQPVLDTDLGEPTGAAYLVAGTTSVWRRNFERGQVWLNTSSWKQQTTKIGALEPWGARIV